MLKTTRCEYKYIISYKTYVQLRPLLELFLIHDKHGEKEDYPVNSIYFDDIYQSGAMDKAFGNETHRKYRVRYYETQDTMKLELKEKIGDISTKYSSYISKDILEALRSNDLDMLEPYMDDEIIRRFMLTSQLQHLEPVLNIQYYREAYKDRSDNLRITFDKYLSSSPIDEYEDEDYIKLMSDAYMLLEVKFEHYLPKEIKTILRKFNLNQIAYSKYFMGYNQFNY